MAGKEGLSTELQRVCRKKWRLDLPVFGNYCNRRFVPEMTLACVREKKSGEGMVLYRGSAGTAAPEKWCYRTQVWSLLSARHHCLEELEITYMEKPRGRILLMLWSDIFFLILKGKLMLTVKSISNQDWNLLYDHGQWTPYCWSHKWCHISAVLWLPIFSPEIPILIKNFNLKGEVSLADSEKRSFVLLVCSWGSVWSRRQFTSFSAPSCPSGPVWRQTNNLHCESKFDVRAEESTGLELAFRDEGMPLLVNSTNPKYPVHFKHNFLWTRKSLLLCPSPVPLSSAACALNQQCLVWLSN